MITLLLFSTLPLASPLSEQDVVEAVDARVPEIALALAEQQIAEGLAQKANGAFDPSLHSSLQSEVLGPYERTYASAQIRQTTPYGIDWSFTHRYGGGEFPSYYGHQETLSIGESRLGIYADLLGTMGLPEARARRLIADGRSQAQAKATQSVRQQITGAAASAYWNWVQAHQRRVVEQEFVELASARQDGLDARVQSGALAPIEAIDNRRALLKRQASLALAEQAERLARIKLAWYLRDELGEPKMRERAIPPQTLQFPEHLSSIGEDQAIERALEARPDLAELRALTDVAETALRRARINLQPRLNVGVEIAQDVGTGAAGLVGPEVDFGMNLSMPLLLREARGERARAEAALTKIQTETNALRQSISLEVTASIARVDAAAERWRLAEQSVKLAREVLTLEREAFEFGSSDIFRLTNREEAVARAQAELIDAHLEYRLATTSLRTFTAAW